MPEPQPFFETEAQPDSRGRLLLISYHFPPGQATGALRWQKLARFAAAGGWSLDVVTLDPHCLQEPEPERLEELPAGIRIFGVPATPALLVERIVESVWNRVHRDRGAQREHGAHRGSGSDGGAGGPDSPVGRPRPTELGWREIRWLPPSPRTPIRAYYAWLEHARDGRWARSAARLALSIARTGSMPTAVISCGPPHLAHEAGRRVARALGVPFVMDLRDPWSLTPRLAESFASPVWYYLARRYERRAVRQVGGTGLVVTNSAVAQEAMQALYPETATRVITVMNGFDDDPIPPPAPDSRFLIAYAGAIYMDRNPRALFQATARLVRELELKTDDLGIEFIGEVAAFNGISLETIAAEEGIADFVRIRPRVPRREALELLSRAAVLVNLPQDVAVAIPSKLFDYMRYPAWLLVLATKDSASERLLRGTGADLIEPDDVAGITSILRTRYLQHLTGTRPPRIADEVPHYSRRAQAEILFSAIERITPTPHPASGALAGGDGS